MTGHTEGPWRVNSEDPYEFESEAWGGIGFVHNEPYENEPLMVQARANARLIAAAPELLAALKFTVDSLTATYGADEISVVKAMKAIKKAEGTL